jgi:rhodanese-related sulfurtransferase
MGKPNECKNEKTEYVPKRAAINIKGATVHLVDGDDTMIDQFWFAKIVLDKLPTNLQLVDVRSAEQYAEGHIKGAINVPFIDDKIDASKLSKDKLNVFYCNTGMKSSEAIQTVKDNKLKVIYFDANIQCKGEECTVLPNELL